jgi:hypothetical protein
MTYRSRIKFRCPPGRFLDLDGSEHPVSGTPYVLRSGEDAGTPVSRSRHLTLSAGGFEQEEQAELDGRVVKDALLWASTRIRIGLDVGADRRQGSIAQAEKDRHYRAHGCRLQEDVHGLVVVSEAEPVQFSSISMQVATSVNADRFSAAIAYAYNSKLRFNAKAQLAAEIYNSGFSEATVRSRFLTYVMAMEVLADPGPLGEALQELVSQFISITEDDNRLSEEDRRSLAQRLRHLKRESIRGSCRRLARELLPTQMYEERIAEDLARQAYDLRSKLVHEGEANLGMIEMSRFTGSVEQLVSDLILGYVERSHEGALEPFREPGPYVDRAAAAFGPEVDVEPTAPG